MTKAPYRKLIPNIQQGTTFKIIGLGGVGGVVARYLAIFLAQHPVRLVLVDGDTFEPANASRMMFNQFGNKAEVIWEELIPHLRNSQANCICIDEYVTTENVGRLIQNKDIVILAVDNHTTRKLVNDHCASLQECVLISGGNDGMEEEENGKVHRGTFGNVQVFIRRNGMDASPQLTRYHPEIKEPADKHPDDISCAEMVVSVPQILFTNMMVATSILGTLWLYLSDGLHYSEVAFDLADAVMNPIPIQPPKLNE
jgi:molybdopterin/thiamine biosynthesis adenylyltransferase